MSFKKEMSASFRRSILVAIPVATVVGMTALAYAVPNVFSSGQQLSSALMNANFSELETEIGGPIYGASLQSQITSLQSQVNSLNIPAPPLTYDTYPAQAAFSYAGGAQYIPTGVSFTPTATYNCMLVASCALPAADCAGNIASLNIAYTGTGVYTETNLPDWYMPFPTSTNNCSASVNSFIQVQAYTDYSFDIQINNLTDNSGGQNIVCNFTMQCA
jgi:hypothetical protein